MNKNGRPEAPLMRADHLSRRYSDGAVLALDDVTVSVDYGEYVAIMGPSGSGKSTLLSILGGLDRPSSGEVYFEGRPLSAMANLDEFRARKIGFVFQSFHLLNTLSAIENVQIPMFESDLPRRERTDKAAGLLNRFGMGHRLNHHPPQLSVGERQRVAIARALANDPQLIFADEPTGNLDSKTEAEVLDLFAELHAEVGKALIIVTHSEEVGRRAERLIRIRDGRIEGEATAPTAAPVERTAAS